MFVQEHHVSMLIYFEHCRHLETKYTHGWDHFVASSKKCYLLRIAATIDALKGAVIGFIIQTTRGLNEFFFGILHFDPISFKNSAHYLLGAVIDLTSLPIIGLIGIGMPSLAITLTAKVSEKAKEVIDKQSELHYRTKSFSEITGRLCAPLRGTTDAIADTLLAISQMITKIVHYPVAPHCDFMNDLIIPFFKGSPKSQELIHENYCLADACIKILAGGSGIIFSESRNYLDIYP